MDYFEEVVFKILNANLMSFFKFWIILVGFYFFKSTELSYDSDIGFADYFLLFFFSGKVLTVY